MWTSIWVFRWGSKEWVYLVDELRLFLSSGWCMHGCGHQRSCHLGMGSGSCRFKGGLSRDWSNMIVLVQRSRRGRDVWKVVWLRG